MIHSTIKPEVINILNAHYWCLERNLKEFLEMASEKNITPKFLEIAQSFLGIEIFYQNQRSVKCAIYFDLDESKVSKNMRARYFNYSNHEDPNWIADPDYRETEDFNVTSRIIGKIGERCSRIAFWDDGDNGFDLYVTADGKIYGGNYDDPVFLNNSIEEFLNENVAGQ